jgi:hypothetical protein
MTELAPEDRVSAIRASLVDQLRDRHPLLGSKLGLALRQRWPSVSLRLEFGGLRRFIDDHCFGVISWLGKHGGDDLFGFPGDSPQPAALPQESGGSLLTAWDALTRPDFPRFAALNPISGDLITVAAGSVPPEEYRQIDGLSVEDHRSIARDFLAGADERARPRLEAALAQPIFWSSWLETLKDVNLWQEWWRSRFVALEKIIKARFAAAGAAPGLSEAVWSHLKQSRRRDIDVSKPGQRTEASLGLHRPAGIATELPQLRTIAQLAISLMSDTELRDLRIPLGALADALRQISKQ